jgi:hypothetical protein
MQLAGGLAGDLEPFLDRVDQQEQQQADRQGERELEPLEAAAPQRRVEQHAERHRHDPDEQSDRGEQPQLAPGQARRRQCDVCARRRRRSARSR